MEVAMANEDKKTNFKDKLGGALSGAKDVMEKSVDAAKVAMDKSIDVGKDVADKAKDVTKDVMEKSVDAAKIAVDKSIDVGKDVAGKTKEVTKGAIDKSAEVTKDVAGKTKEIFDKKEDDNNDTDNESKLSIISTSTALKIIYLLMSVDGNIHQNEEEKFNEIGNGLDPDFVENKEEIISYCREKLSDAKSGEYLEYIIRAAEHELKNNKITEDSFITPKLFIWDLFTIAFSDNDYDESEKKLIKHISDLLSVDNSVYLEMESSILTLMAIEKELEWVKTTDRPYIKVEAVVNELNERRAVIFESVKDLISL